MSEGDDPESEATQPDVGPPWWKIWRDLAYATTIYVGVGVSLGGILALITLGRGKNPFWWFFYGSLVPPGLLAWWFASDWMVRKKLENLRQWKEQGLLPTRAYDQMVKDLTEWYKRRWFRDRPPKD